MRISFRQKEALAVKDASAGVGIPPDAQQNFFSTKTVFNDDNTIDHIG